MSFHPNDPSVLAKASNCPWDIHSMAAGAPTATLKLASHFSQLTNPFIMTLASKLAPCTIPSPACHPATGTGHGALLQWLLHALLMGAPMCVENQLQMVQNVIHLVFNQPEVGPRHHTADRAPMATWSCPHQVQAGSPPSLWTIMFKPA